MVAYVLIQNEYGPGNSPSSVTLAAAFNKTRLEDAVKGYIEQYLEARRRRYVITNVVINDETRDDVHVVFFAKDIEERTSTFFMIKEVPLVDAPSH